MRTSWTAGALCALMALLLVGCGEGFHNQPLQRAELRGRIVNADPAVASVTVLVDDDSEPDEEPDDDDVLLTTGVDAEGRFVLRDVPATRLTLYLVGAATRAGYVTVEVQGARVTDLGDVVLAEAASITVRVVDEGGAPIASAEVDLDETPFERRPVDAEGRVTFGPLPPGCYRVRARAEPYEEVEQSACVAMGQALEFTVTLPVDE